MIRRKYILGVLKHLTHIWKFLVSLSVSTGSHKPDFVVIVYFYSFTYMYKTSNIANIVAKLVY